MPPGFDRRWMGGSGGAGQNYVLSKLAIIVSIAPLKNCNTMIFVVLIVIASCLLPFPSLLGATGASAIGRRNRVRGRSGRLPSFSGNLFGTGRRKGGGNEHWCAF